MVFFKKKNKKKQKRSNGKEREIAGVLRNGRKSKERKQQKVKEKLKLSNGEKSKSGWHRRILHVTPL